MFKQFTRSLGSNGPEGQLIKSILISLISSFLIVLILYFVALKNLSEFIPKYGFYLFFAILSYALIITSANHIRAYKEFACMPGMMVGMTLGMISGFLPGLFAGSTNGMFWGSLLGMAVGITFGTWNGKCCGIMGIMEGMMAGFMGGLMGAMTSIMMINDNLKAASIVLFIISSVIILGLNYMVYKETREAEKSGDEGSSFIVFWSILLTALTTWLMVFGPRSILFQ